MRKDDAVILIAKGKKMSFKQGAELISLAHLEFINPETGRKIKFKGGQKFWVTNTMHDQQSNGIVKLQRAGKGHISTGYPFSPEQVKEFFLEITE